MKPVWYVHFEEDDGFFIVQCRNATNVRGTKTYRKQMPIGRIYPKEGYYLWWQRYHTHLEQADLLSISMIMDALKEAYNNREGNYVLKGSKLVKMRCVKCQR